MNLSGTDRSVLPEVVRDLFVRPGRNEAVFRAKQEWEATVDALTDSVVLTSADGTVVRCNKATCRAAGAGFGSVLGRHIDEIFWTRSVGGPRVSLLGAGTSEVAALGRWYRVTCNHLGGERRGTGWVYVIRDETVEREARERTAQQRERFAAILDSLADAVLAVDSDERITLMNGSAEQLTGVPFASGRGRSLSEVYRTEVAPDPSTCSAGLGGDGAESTEAVRSFFLHRPAGPPLRVTQRRSALRDAKGQPGSVLVVRDVTALRHLQAIAASVDLTNNLGHLVAGVRHELGNPLNALKTALTILRETFGQVSPERSLVLIDRALKDASRIEKLLERLRKLSLIGGARPGTHDITELLLRLGVCLRETLAQESAHLDLRVPREPVAAWVDPEALEQVLLGFVNNAMDATLGAADRRIRIDLAPEDRVVRLRVGDSGPGFTPEALQRAFVPLYTTKPRGTGLGLPIARHLLSRMGATVSVSNAPTGGAVVEVVLWKHPALTP